MIRKSDMDIMIREIESKDYHAAAAIWRDVLDIPSATDENVIRIYEKMKGDDRYRTFVADWDGKVIGLAATVETLSIGGNPDGYIKLNGLAVLPEYQHCGIGTKLIKRVEALAKERGTLYIGLASGFQRTDAHAFYEHLGYQKTSFWFRKRIKDEN
ncbi:MAG: GNAT family N-acetyltransferase [Clostridia bacterium]|nr:GNAT family N-acetyltransferase [Clostridia bacterium]